MYSSSLHAKIVFEIVHEESVKVLLIMPCLCNDHPRQREGPGVSKKMM